jgi:hypothetical protein
MIEVMLFHFSFGMFDPFCDCINHTFLYTEKRVSREGATWFVQGSPPTIEDKHLNFG